MNAKQFKIELVNWLKQFDTNPNEITDVSCMMMAINLAQRPRSSRSLRSMCKFQEKTGIKLYDKAQSLRYYCPKCDRPLEICECKKDEEKNES